MLKDLRHHGQVLCQLIKTITKTDEEGAGGSGLHYDITAENSFTQGLGIDGHVAHVLKLANTSTNTVRTTNTQKHAHTHQ